MTDYVYILKIHENFSMDLSNALKCNIHFNHKCKQNFTFGRIFNLKVL